MPIIIFKKVLIVSITFVLLLVFSFLSVQWFVLACQFAFQKSGKVLIPIGFRALAPIVAILLGIVLQRLKALACQKDQVNNLTTHKRSVTVLEKSIFFLPLVLLAAWPFFARFSLFESPLFWVIAFIVWWAFLYFRFFCKEKPAAIPAVMLWIILGAWSIVNIFFMVDPVAAFLYRLLDGKLFLTLVPFTELASLEYTAATLYFPYVFHYMLLLLCSFGICCIAQKQNLHAAHH